MIKKKKMKEDLTERNEGKEEVEEHQKKKLKIDLDYINQPKVIKFENTGEFEIEG